MKENIQVDYDDVEKAINQNKLRSAASLIRKRIHNESSSGSERIINKVIRDFAQDYVENELSFIDETDIVTTQHNEKVGLTNHKYNGIYCEKSYVLPMRSHIAFSNSKEDATRMIRNRLNAYIAEVVTQAIESERHIMHKHTSCMA